MKVALFIASVLALSPSIPMAQTLWVERESEAFLDEDVLRRSDWPADTDGVLPSSTVCPEQASCWIERAAVGGFGDARLLSLASIHRSDTLSADARLRLIESLGVVETATHRDSLRSLLEISIPVDLSARATLARIQLSESPEERTALDVESLRTLDDWCELESLLGLPDVADRLQPYFITACLDRLPEWSEGSMPAVARARLELGRSLYASGDGEEARTVLSSVWDNSAVPAPERCEAAIWYGRSHGRTGRSSESTRAYRWVLDHCESGDLLVRALFGLGRRCSRNGDVGCAEEHLGRLVREFGEVTHADDALFYLAHAHRTASDWGAELTHVHSSLAQPADGDMWRETLWRAIAYLISQDEPDSATQLLDSALGRGWDPTYYSQGRFEYFQGRLRSDAGDLDAAQASFQAGHREYPLTFYGELSCHALNGMGGDCEPHSFELSSPASALWPLGTCLGDDPRFRGLIDAGRLIQAASYLDLAHGECEEALWIQAMLWDLAGEYSLSHNIPRRRLSGWQREVSSDSRRRWEVAYPTPFREIVMSESARTGVEPALIYAIMREESAFVSAIHSYAGAQGLMQLMPRTARGHAEDVDGEVTIARLAEPEINIRIGANFLAHLARHLDSNPVLMVAAYNAGRGAVGRWLRSRPFEESGWWVEHIGPTQTRNYSKRVLWTLEVYRTLYSWER